MLPILQKTFKRENHPNSTLISKENYKTIYKKLIFQDDRFST